MLKRGGYVEHDDIRAAIFQGRLTGDPALTNILKTGGAMDKIARDRLGEAVRPVRAILFDKHPGTNWALGWHQDRTIAVRRRIEVPGFGPWSRKSGIDHVEPPFAIIEQMITLRVHLDDCGEDNAPLLIAQGSHKLGRVPVNQIEHVVSSQPQFACLADAGDVWVYATAILHASDAAAIPSHRRVLHVDYAAASLPSGLEWYGIR